MVKRVFTKGLKTFEIQFGFVSHIAHRLQLVNDSLWNTPLCYQKIVPKFWYTVYIELALYIYILFDTVYQYLGTIFWWGPVPLVSARFIYLFITNHSLYLSFYNSNIYNINAQRTKSCIFTFEFINLHLFFCFVFLITEQRGTYCVYFFKFKKKIL